MKHSIEFDQLFDVTVAMEIDLESLDTGRFSVAQQVGSNLGGRTVPAWTGPCRPAARAR